MKQSWKTSLAAATLSIMLPLQYQSVQADEYSDMLRKFNRYLQLGIYSKVIPASEELLNLAVKKFGRGHPRHIRIQNSRGTIFTQLGMVSISEALHLQALNIAREVQGNESRPTMETHVELGDLYSLIGRIKDAQQHYKKAVAIAEKLLGTDNLETRIIKNNYAFTKRAEG